MNVAQSQGNKNLHQNGGTFIRFVQPSPARRNGVPGGATRGVKARHNGAQINEYLGGV